MVGIIYICILNVNNALNTLKSATYIGWRFFFVKGFYGVFVSEAVECGRFMFAPIPCGFIRPVAKVMNIKINKSKDRVMRKVSDFTVFLDCSSDLWLIR